MKKIFIIIIDILILIFALLFIKDVYISIRDYRLEKKIIDKLDIPSDIPSSNEDEAKKAMVEKYNKLKEANSDYRFWIDIENTNINYPVVQTSDNDYYLYRDFEKNENIFGSIFEDTNTDFNKDFNTILYGHHTTLKHMFTNITKYKDKEFFDQNNKIRIVDKDKEYIFEVFSVYTIRGFDDSKYLYDLNNNEKRSDILTTLKQKSFYDSNDDNDIEKMITLITCSYEQKNTRTVVHAKLLNE